MSSRTARRLALAALTAASLATLACCVVDTPWSPHVFAASIVVFPIALMLLGASQAGRIQGERVRPVVLWTLGIVMLVLATSMAGLHWTRGTEAQLLGLPAGLVLLVVGLFLLPLALSTLGFAASFERSIGDNNDESAGPQ